MFVVDFIHFAALYAILIVLLRLGQGAFTDRPIGKVLAFFG